jgi:hypothetical protein
VGPSREEFRGQRVGELPAIVAHYVSPGSLYWTATWYDQRVDMSYQLELSELVARPYGVALGPGGAEGAQAVAAVAASLVPLH